MTFNRIADALEVNPDWLQSGTGIPYVNKENKSNIFKVPLFDLNYQAIKNSETKQLHSLIVDSNKISEDLFCVNLDNSSMEPIFKEKTLLIFSRDKTPENKNYVLAFIPSVQEVVFRQLLIEGKRRFLKAENPIFSHYTQDLDFEILGVLIEARFCFD
ncbi:MAG: hypothetical protein Tsb005_21620 [Gammaproteobacteria bacterium]